jgi:hypothetical protein
MRRDCLIAVVMIGLTWPLCAFAADDQAPAKSDSSWFSSWGPPRDTWGTRRRYSTRSTKDDEQKAKDEQAAAKAKADLAAAAAARRLEDSALLRRLAVCDQLRLVASRTGDETLLHKADELDDRARAVYAMRIARLPVSQPAEAPPSRKEKKK